MGRVWGGFLGRLQGGFGAAPDGIPKPAAQKRRHSGAFGADFAHLWAVGCRFTLKSFISAVLFAVASANICGALHCAV